MSSQSHITTCGHHLSMMALLLLASTAFIIPAAGQSLSMYADEEQSEDVQGSSTFLRGTTSSGTGQKDDTGSTGSVPYPAAAHNQPALVVRRIHWSHLMQIQFLKSPILMPPMPMPALWKMSPASLMGAPAPSMRRKQKTTNMAG